MTRASKRAHRHLADGRGGRRPHGAELIVLHDQAAGPDDRVCDPHLAIAAVDKALREALKEDGSSWRRDASLVLQAAGIRNVHDVMVALGFGAQALCPYAMMEKAMDGSPEPSAAATHVLEALQKGIEKVLSTLGIHELRGYGRLVSAIGVSPEVLDILAIPGFCASDGRGLGLDALDALPSRAARSAPGRRALQGQAPADVPQGLEGAGAGRHAPSAATRSTPRRSTSSRPSSRWPCATRCSRSSPSPSTVSRPTRSPRVGEHSLPFLISSMSFGSQGETAFRSYAEAAHAPTCSA